MKKAESGFTLIELVMVIVIIGILAAVAVPKFLNMGSEARTGVMKAVEGSMRAANSIIYAKASASNQLGSSGKITSSNTIDINTIYGYAADVKGLVAAMDLIPATDFDTTTSTVKHNGASDKATCVITYSPSTGAAVIPIYASVYTGC